MEVSKTELHVVCLPLPFQSHIGAMLKLAKLLHHRGCCITFVNTEYNHTRLLRVKDSHGGPFDNLPSDFRFMSIPDGIPLSDSDASVDMEAMCKAVVHHLKDPVCNLIRDMNERDASEPKQFPRVSSIVADGFMSFSACPAGERNGIPVFNLFTVSACSLMVFTQFANLMDKGIIPLKDETYLTNGYLDTTIDWIPGMKQLRLGDLPSYIRCTDQNDFGLNVCIESTSLARKAAAVVLHTLEALEQDVLDALSATLQRPVYAIGPFQPLIDQIPDSESCVKHVNCNLWKTDTECLRWLDSHKPGTVMYVNFGSIVFLTPEQLVELAMGIANSNSPFLWVIRSDLVSGEAAILPREFMEETRGRGFLCNWCPQEEVLNHPAIGGFLTHCGWNSIMESLSAGVPMLCWPFISDQLTNCKYVCIDWEVGIHIDGSLERDGVKSLVREVMEGEKGKRMKKKAMEWKKQAMEATGPHGSSSANLDIFLQDLLSKIDMGFKV
ncbi:hypothetical protein SAY86_009756 [Trapa natans]|uniref:Glycosyltransferase n=1 Tax=Trapa natans TaxID=22666 RepID=A0AAN7KXB7_TRANT|nr:hypothetical protein SAY86_009756 [Trapa natans]